MNPTKSTSTPTIQEEVTGRGSIRTELLAHAYNQPQKQLSIQTLLRIQKVIDYMQRKGRTHNTLDGIEKHLKQIAMRADLDNPLEVETAIARYTCIDPITRKPAKRAASNLLHYVCTRVIRKPCFLVH